MFLPDYEIRKDYGRGARILHRGGNAQLGFFLGAMVPVVPLFLSLLYGNNPGYYYALLLNLFGVPLAGAGAAVAMARHLRRLENAPIYEEIRLTKLHGAEFVELASLKMRLMIFNAFVVFMFLIVTMASLASRSNQINGGSIFIYVIFILNAFIASHYGRLCGVNSWMKDEGREALLTDSIAQSLRPWWKMVLVLVFAIIGGMFCAQVTASLGFLFVSVLVLVFQFVPYATAIGRVSDELRYAELPQPS